MSDLIDFLLARIAEDEEQADRVEFRPYVGEGVPQSLRARVLAECEAKRRIVELIHEEAWSDPAWDHALDAVFANLAAIYADHPDYRAEWKP